MKNTYKYEFSENLSTRSYSFADFVSVPIWIQRFDK